MNEFIRYLGTNYFDTSYSNGTITKNIWDKVDKYLLDRGYSSYYLETSKNYNDYYNAIVNCGMIVPVSIYNIWDYTEQQANEYVTKDYSERERHTALGIGIRQIVNGNNTSRFIVSNYARNDTMSEFSFNSTWLREFFFVHK